MRVSKAPEERKQEILRTAMRLFTQKGYENTSMRDIAREMNVVQGLCYRYFDSKQKLFHEAMETYANECCAGFIRVLHDPDLTFDEKLNWMFDAVKQDGMTMPYEEFFHKPENESFHQQLALRLCGKLKPHLSEELKREAANRKAVIHYPELTAELITYGQIGPLSQSQKPTDKELDELKRMIRSIIDNAMTPE